MGDGLAEAAFVGGTAGCVELAIRTCGTKRKSATSTDSSAGSVGTSDAAIFAEALVAAIFVGESLAVFVFFAFIEAGLGKGLTSAFVFDRDTDSSGFAGIVVGFVVATADGFDVIGATAWRGFADAAFVGRTAGCVELTVRACRASRKAATSAGLDAGLLGASDLSIAATAGIAAVFVGEGLAIFVVFAFVGAAFGGRWASAFCFDGDPGCVGCTSVRVRFFIAATNRRGVACAGLRFFLTKQRCCARLAQTFRKEAEGASLANSGVGGEIGRAHV